MIVKKKKKNSGINGIEPNKTVYFTISDFENK